MKERLPGVENKTAPTPPGPPMPAKPCTAQPADLDMSGISKINESTAENVLYSSTPSNKRKEASLGSCNESFFSEFDTSFSESSLSNITLCKDKIHKVVNDLNLKAFNPASLKLKSFYNEVCGAANEAINYGFEIFLPSSSRASKVNRSMESLKCGLSSCGKPIGIGERYSECVILYPEFHPYCTLDLKEIPLSHGNGLAICPLHTSVSRSPELLSEINRKVRVYTTVGYYSIEFTPLQVAGADDSGLGLQSSSKKRDPRTKEKGTAEKKT